MIKQPVLSQYLHELILKTKPGKSAIPNGETYAIITPQEYETIFWTLFTKPKSALEPGNNFHVVKLVSQLNSLIIFQSKKYQLELNNPASSFDAEKFNKSLEYPAKVSLKMPLKMQRPKPSIRGLHFEQLQLLSELDKQFHSSVNSADYLESRQHTAIILGRVIYSSMRFGGLLRQDLQLSLFALLRERKPKSFDGVCWFELTGAAGETHIWIPDPITTILLGRFYQYRSLTMIDERLHLELCLRKFLTASGADVLKKLRIRAFFSLIRARLSLEHTPCHLPILTGEQANLTLLPECFYRLIGLKRPTSTFGAPEAKATQSFRITQNPAPMLTNAPQCATLMTSVKKLLKRASDQTLKLRATSEELKQLADSDNCIVLPITRLLIRWAAVRLTSQSRWTGKLNPNSLLSYLGSIFMPFRLILGERNLLLLSDSERSEIYLELIDQKPALPEQLKCARILRDFDIFLEKEYGLATSHVFFGIIFQANRKLPLMVDATIVLPSEYDTVLQQLEVKHFEPDTKLYEQARQVLLILGFRLGLRRTEAYKLRLLDLITPNTEMPIVSELTELQVHPYIGRTLKSASAKRRLPLGLLLTAQERNFFNDYLKRFHYNSSNSALLFAKDNNANSINELMDEGRLFDPLIHRLQNATGHASLRFHHLRHSFATWTFWYWQRHKYSSYFPFSERLDHPCMQHLTKVRNHLLATQEGLADRRDLHAISILIGHSSPSMTLMHYLHSVQWAYCAEFWQRHQFNQTQAAALLNLPRKSFYNNLETKGYARTIMLKLTEFSDAQVAEACIDKLMPQQITSTIKQSVIADIDHYRAFRYYIANARNLTTIEDWCLKQNLNSKHLVESYQLFTQALEFERPRQIKVKKGAFNKELNRRAKLPLFPVHHYASKTLMRLLEQFHLLDRSLQTDIIKACKKAVMSCLPYWNEIRLFTPEDLWDFVIKISPLIAPLLPEQKLQIVLHAPSAKKLGHQSLLAKRWQLEKSSTYGVSLGEYSNTFKPPYIALTLTSLTTGIKKREIADHGFKVCMYILYLTHGSAFEIYDLES